MFSAHYTAYEWPKKSSLKVYRIKGEFMRIWWQFFSPLPPPRRKSRSSASSPSWLASPTTCLWPCDWLFPLGKRSLRLTTWAFFFFFINTAMEEWQTTRKRRRDYEFTDMELLERDKLQFCERIEGTAKWTDESLEGCSVDEWISRR